MATVRLIDLVNRERTNQFTGAPRNENNKVKMYVQLVINIKLKYLRICYFYKISKNV